MPSDLARERRAEALEQPMNERAGEAAAARVDLVPAPLSRRSAPTHRVTATRGKRERIDQRGEIVRDRIGTVAATIDRSDDGRSDDRRLCTCASRL